MTDGSGLKPDMTGLLKVAAMMQFPLINYSVCRVNSPSKAARSSNPLCDCWCQVQGNIIIFQM
jgi:hypothetical protein